MKKYYLILSEYVGPNSKDSRGNIIGDSRIMGIYTSPGITNSSHEARVGGWLGTTNDESLTAYGEFNSMESARRDAHRLGFTERRSTDDDEFSPISDDLVEEWLTPAAAREQWDADDYFHGCCSRDVTIDTYGINANTTDDELDLIIEQVEAEAEIAGVELHGLTKLFHGLRDDLEKN